jgi:ATPase subunit of ABC transporter with duplicated ATPase domains
MNMKVLNLLVAVVTLAFVLVGSSQQAQAKEWSERAEEKAERKAEKAEKKAERRAEKIEERCEERTEKREDKAKEKAKKKARKRSEERAESTKERSGGNRSESRRSGSLTLKIQGGKGAEFSGTCTVGGEEHDVSGRVPQSFEYSLDGEKLECEIRKENVGAGALKVVLIGNGIHAVQQISSGGTVSLTYDGNSISSSTSSSGSTNAVSSSSSTSSQ